MKNMKNNIYISMYEHSLKNSFIKEEFNDEDAENEYYLNTKFSPDDIEINGTELTVFGDIETENNKRLGYLTLDIKLDMDIMAQIITSYMKQIGRLKTVVESLSNMDTDTIGCCKDKPKCLACEPSKS